MILLALGWKAQAKVDGGFNRETRESLSRLIANLNAGRNINSGFASAKPRLTPGSLVREWHGTLHQVRVLSKQRLPGTIKALLRVVFDVIQD